MKAMRNIRFALGAAVAALMTFASVAQEAAAKGKPEAAKPAATAKAEGKADKKYKPLAEARDKIGQIISEPSMMTEVMKELSPEDQKSFVADVNAAIAKLPGSVEDKTAKYLNVNKAALKGSASGNMANVLAVTFASVPPESLAVLSESYATDLFNRDADPSQRISDAAFEKTAAEVIGKVEQATSGSDDAGVRNTLAVLMFVRASNNSIDGLSDRLADTMPDATTRELAKKEWIPAALAEGEKKSYDAMLAYADAGKAPNIELVIVLAQPQILEAMLVDITSGMNDKNQFQTTPVVDQGFGGFEQSRINNAELTTDIKSAANSAGGGQARPRTTNPLAPWNPEYKRGEIQVTRENVDALIVSTIEEQSDPDYKKPTPEPEPKPYPYTDL